MKQYKSKDNFMKEKILERNSRIENFVVNYLTTKNGYDIEVECKKLQSFYYNIRSEV